MRQRPPLPLRSLQLQETLFYRMVLTDGGLLYPTNSKEINLTTAEHIFNFSTFLL